MTVQHLQFDDIGAYQEATAGFDLESTQIDRGRISLDYDVLELGDVVLRRFRCNLRMVESIQVAPGSIAIVAVSQPVLWQEHLVPAGSAVAVFPEHGGRACLPAGWDSVELVAPRALVEEHRLLPARWLDAPPGPGAAVFPLGRRNEMMLGRLRRALHAPDSGAKQEAAPAEALVEALATGFQRLARSRAGSARPVVTDREREVVDEAQRLIRRNLSAPLRIDGLAREIGVSDRWIRSCFRAAVGVGPYRYALLAKLQGARRELQRGQGGPRPVTCAAERFGFQNLSRFSEQYRAQFGESPGATAARAR